MKKRKDAQKPDVNHYNKFDTCSSTECTGLITVPPENEDELENYMDVYDFGPPIAKENTNKNN